MSVKTQEFSKSKGASFICEISAPNLAKIIAEGLITASQPKDFPKYHGTCLLKTSEGHLTAVSTDGKRLAVAKAPCEQTGNDEKMILSASAVKEFGKTLASNHSNENVKIFADSSTVWFQLENGEFPISKLLEVEFPKYERILNNTVQTTMKFNPPDLITVLDKINIISAMHLSKIMVLKLDPDNNEATIYAHHPDYGTVLEKFNAEIEQHSLQIGFNIDYFLDGLKAAGNNSTVIEFSGEEAQAQIKRENDDSFLYVIMPSRLIAEDLIDC